MFEHLVLRDLETTERNPPRVKRNREEWMAMWLLASDQRITIKPVNKRGGIVITDTMDYEKQIERQLNEEDFYGKMDCDPSDHILKIIKVVLWEALALDYINNSTAEFLINKTPRVPIFHTIPKIHKKESPSRGRPIVSGINSVLELLSKYVDQFLQPLMRDILSLLLLLL